MKLITLGEIGVAVAGCGADFYLVTLDKGDSGTVEDIKSFIRNNLPECGDMCPVEKCGHKIYYEPGKLLEGIYFIAAQGWKMSNGN